VVKRVLILALLLCANVSLADDSVITLASTTSTDNSGLLAELLPLFEKKSGVEVRVVTVGTGQALRLARQGDVDLVLVHDRKSEDLLVAEGGGVGRKDVMYNDFILVGPTADPAQVRGHKSVIAALKKIQDQQSLFLSRGDDSGTHKAELRLWADAEIDPSVVTVTGYRELGAGMGATLNTAAAMGAYTLVDRGTWLSFGNRGDLVILVEGDPRLFNPYGVILVNPDRHPHVNHAGAIQLADWLVSQDGQSAIAHFRVAGQPLFQPNAD
jgi:tungstate transport system substrate-binding protein